MTGVKDVRSLQDVDTAASAGHPVVLDFWASWCEPCKAMDAVLTQLSAEYPGVSILRVEAEVVDEVTLKYDITTVPSFVFLKGGKEVDRLEGADAPALTAKTAALLQPSASTTGPASTAAPVASTSAPAAAAGAGVAGRIKYLLATFPVLLFMKGEQDSPKCGFSSRVVEALRSLRVPFKSIDILGDEALRNGLKEFSNWPTYPQLYIKGELVGGCDIVTEMAGSGELKQLLVDKLGLDYGSAAAAALAAAESLAGPTAAAPASAPAPKPAPTPAPAPAESKEALHARINTLLAQQPVMLFMKGSPDAPKCGFSRKVSEALKSTGVEYGSFDILTDEGVRQGLKEISNWPTYPQVYVRGELLGGCDIVLEMQQSNELKSTVDEMLHRMDVP